MEQEILKIKENRHGRVGQVFKMKENIAGQKKAGVEPHAVTDSKTGELMVANKDIKRVTLEYCVDNLRNREADPEAVHLVEQTRALVEEKLKYKKEDFLEVSKKDFEEVVKKFKSKQTKSYDFLIKSGVKYQEAIFKFCHRIIEDEELPTMFRKTLLYMIWKQKGGQNVLKNNRFIHLKEHYLPRTVEAIVVNKMKEDILNHSTMYKIGG